MENIQSRHQHHTLKHLLILAIGFGPILSQRQSCLDGYSCVNAQQFVFCGEETSEPINCPKIGRFQTMCYGGAVGYGESLDEAGPCLREPSCTESGAFLFAAATGAPKTPEVCAAYYKCEPGTGSKFKVQTGVCDFGLEFSSQSGKCESASVANCSRKAGITTPIIVGPTKGLPAVEPQPVTDKTLSGTGGVVIGPGIVVTGPGGVENGPGGVVSGPGEEETGPGGVVTGPEEVETDPDSVENGLDALPNAVTPNPNKVSSTKVIKKPVTTPKQEEVDYEYYADYDYEQAEKPGRPGIAGGGAGAGACKRIISPDPSSCRHYLVCSQRSGQRRRKCPGNLLFNDRWRFCTRNVKCGTRKK